MDFSIKLFGKKASYKINICAMIAVAAILVAMSKHYCLAGQNLPSEKDILADIPTLLSPTRLNQPIIEAPSAIAPIDREMIEASGFREIPGLPRLAQAFGGKQKNSEIALV